MTISKNPPAFENRHRSSFRLKLDNYFTLRLACLIFAMGTYSCAALASSDSTISQTCDDVSRIVSAETGVPISVLRAITRTETGRNSTNGSIQPWPWTVNMEGKGVWFNTEDEARAYVFRHFKRGARSFDVGCFQINYKWHGQAFKSIDEMFDPLANARYAANFLADLFAETANWSNAAGAYHSRTPKYANKYKKIFNRHHARMLATPLPENQIADANFGHSPPTQPKIRINTFPLLQPNSTSVRLGSLVPLGAQREISPLFSIHSKTEG